MSSEKSIGIIYGGKSPEHNISITSAENIYNTLKSLNYFIKSFYIDKTGENWYIENPKISNSKNPLPESQNISKLTDNLESKSPLEMSKIIEELKKCECVFIMVHGNTGEDGVLAGFLQTLGIKYIGCNLESSALTFDKHRTKLALAARNLPIAPFFHIDVRDGFGFVEEYLNKSLKKDFFPCFIKPCRSGSSYGINKISEFGELLPAIRNASQYDYSILVEKAIIGREIECAVLEGEKATAPKVSLPAEIKIKDSGNAFYSTEAKYENDSVPLETPAQLSQEQILLIQKVAATSFAVLECQSMARVDMFLINGNSVIINEINTIPGFTSISQFPKMWQTSGLPMPALLQELIKTAHY
ncbi:MAG: D-alanine--D-alanine ligase [Bifidobacteriaceae bacterium]|jgi:D-alanine-D-alanine ligase|nr:D-alanine--D-alanine ligase [Bifidobacteriaceae bacterium]